MTTKSIASKIAHVNNLHVVSCDGTIFEIWKREGEKIIYFVKQPLCDLNHATIPTPLRELTFHTSRNIFKITRQYIRSFVYKRRY